MKKKILIISFCAAVLVTLSSIYGWFLYIQNKNINGVINVTDNDANAVVELYVGKDFDKNGALDAYIENGVEIDPLNVTRKKWVENCYLLVDKDDKRSLQFNNLNPGNKITYFLLIKNGSDKKIEVSTNFDIAKNNSDGAISYELSNLSIKELSADSYNNSLYKDALVVDKDRYILRDYNFHDLDNFYNFIQNIEVSGNSYLMIDFQIEALSSFRRTNYLNSYANIYLQDFYEEYLAKELISSDVDVTTLKSLLENTSSTFSQIKNELDLIDATVLSSRGVTYLDKMKEIIDTYSDDNADHQINKDKAEILRELHNYDEDYEINLAINSLNIIITSK